MKPRPAGGWLPCAAGGRSPGWHGRLRLSIPTLGCALALATASVLAQSATPRLGYVYPAGGRQGTSFQVSIGGQFLNGATNAFVSGNGVQATVVDYIRPLNGKEMNELREKLKELQDRRDAAQKEAREPPTAGASARTNAPLSAAERETMAEIRRQLAASQRRQLNPAISESVTLRIVVAADAMPGDRELRVDTGTGLSNPLHFCIGQLPEFSRPLLADRVEATPPRPAASPRSATPVASVEMGVILPAVLNGQIGSGGVDRFRFAAHRGERLLVAARARALIPYLADAVPGWFQAAVSVADARGHELAFADHYRFQQDPVLFFDVPADGDYVLTIRDTLYRGRDDFVYRLRLGELPFITGHFPLGGRVGMPATVMLTGWNLPVTNLTVDAKSVATGRVPLSVQRDGRDSNPVPFAFYTLPNAPKSSPTIIRATPSLSPCPSSSTAGWIRRETPTCSGSRATRATRSWPKSQARRLGSPLDSVLALTDAAGRQIAANDDHEDKAAWFEHPSRPTLYIRVVLPATGTEFFPAVLSDTEGLWRYRTTAIALRVGRPSRISMRACLSSVSLTYSRWSQRIAHHPCLPPRRVHQTKSCWALKEAGRPGYKLSGCSGCRRSGLTAQTHPVGAAYRRPPPTHPGLADRGPRVTINGREVYPMPPCPPTDIDAGIRLPPPGSRQRPRGESDGAAGQQDQSAERGPRRNCRPAARRGALLDAGSAIPPNASISP